MKSTITGALALSCFLGYVLSASAAPKCKRVATQWTVLFNANCTRWDGKEIPTTGERRQPPKECTQIINGDVMVDAWPWNDDVAVVANERPDDEFAVVQDERNVNHYNAGVVIIHSTWDMVNGWLWVPRGEDKNASQIVGARVDYIATENEQDKFISLTVRVDYEPLPDSNDAEYKLMKFDNSDDDPVPRRGLAAEQETWDSSEEGFGAYEFGFEDRNLKEGLEVPSDFFPDPETVEESSGEYDYDDYSDNLSYSFSSSYHPEYIYSYDDYSYSYSYSMELDELESYTFSYKLEEGQEGDGEEEEELIPDPDDPQSITSVDIYVCKDEENTLAKLRWYCDPDDMGTAQCYKEAGGHNGKALGIHGFEMFCSPACLRGGSGGLWCDVFGLDGCRMCTTDCSGICDEGQDQCRACVRCPSDDESTAPSPSAIETASPTGLSRGSDFFTMTPTAIGDGGETMGPTAGATATSTSTTIGGHGGGGGTLSPTPLAHGGEFHTIAPTVVDNDGQTMEPTAVLMPAPTSTMKAGGEEITTAPTSNSRGDMVGPPTPEPTYVSWEEEFETRAPTTTDRSGFFESAAPTATERGRFSGSAAPTATERGRFSGSAAPTATERDGFSGSAAPTTAERGRSEFDTAAPTQDLEDMPFVECTPGDAQTCYDQLPPSEMGVLENSGRGLTCEESCVANGGPWCRAYGLLGCRFCHVDCKDFCERQGFATDCLCFECE